MNALVPPSDLIHSGAINDWTTSLHDDCSHLSSFSNHSNKFAMKQMFLSEVW